jgi:hypothetical protein
MTPPTPPTAVPGWLAAEIESVPPIDAFATVDELADAGRRLAEAHPGAVRLHRVGTSAQGEPLTCLTVDGGPGAPEALVFGLPHPNEPIGGLTAVHLAQRLAADADLRGRAPGRGRALSARPGPGAGQSAVPAPSSARRTASGAPARSSSLHSSLTS